MKHEGAGSKATELLQTYEALLVERAVPLGLVAERDRGRMWDRHVADCLRGVEAVLPTDHDAYDLGSGAGLPGIVIAIARPGLRVTLVEPSTRRVAFLELVVERLGLANVEIAAQRAEDLFEPADLCFARAFADPEKSWRAAAPLLREAGRLIYFAGSRFRVPQDVPAGVSAALVAERPVASAGPVVIMSRQ